MRALVIDDSSTIRLILRQVLQELGMTVLEAENGLEALEQLQKHPDTALLLVDWNMPEMNGYEFIRTVRSKREHDAARILMVTTETHYDQVASALAAGANEYLMKPFTKEILMAKLDLMDVLQE